MEGNVFKLLVEEGKCKGIILKDGEELRADSVILTTGTFLGGRVHIGNRSMEAGRFMRSNDKFITDFDDSLLEKPSNEMSKSIRELGFPVDRLRTGTPPRILHDTINYSGLEEQLSDDPVQLFSFVNEFKDWKPKNEFIKCYITRTNKETHRIVSEYIEKLPLLFMDDGVSIV